MELLGVDVTVELGATVAAVGAIGTAIAAVVQYYIAERWKRAEFSVAQIRELSEDETFAFCCRAIDWGIGPLIIPTKYRELFLPSRTTVDHDWVLMAKALRPRLHVDWNKEDTRAQFLLYRYAFDDFFGYMDGLHMYRKAGVIKRGDLVPLEYFIKQIAKPLYWENDYRIKVYDDDRKPLEGTKVFGDFIEKFYPERLLPWILSFND